MKYSMEAKTLCEAIKKLAANPDGLENLECYLSYSFAEWLEKYANTPDGIAHELEHFSTI